MTPYSSPLKLFEYLQLGRAIVAPDAENIREVLTNGKDALLFDPATDGALEAALFRLCVDPSLRARLGEAARQTIVKRSLTWSRNAQRVLTIADAVILQSPGRRATATPTVQSSRSVES
jgi:glycosyltransferase involved in cell wall biosynthesis